MRRWMMLAALVVAPVALAQDAARDDKPAAEGGVRYQKTTSIDFEEDTIEGDLTRPDGEYVEARRKVQHSNLIRIREDFQERVMESVGGL